MLGRGGALPLFAASSEETSLYSALILGAVGDPVPDRALLRSIEASIELGKGASGPAAWRLTTDADGDILLWSGEDDLTDALTDPDQAALTVSLGDAGLIRVGTGGRLYLWIDLASGSATGIATLTGEQR